MARELELTWKIYPRMLLVSRDHEDIKWLSHDTLSIRRPGPFLLSLRLAHTCSHHAFNMDGQRAREGELPRIEQGASRVKRLGHLVLESADPAGLFDWYHKYFGLMISDAVRLPDQSPQMIFARLDRSETYVDHHVIGFQWALDERTRVQHVAFEVSNLDDLMSGHDHLKGGAYKHVWGIGRHLLGGQIFDYWKSPFGLIHEHWTDTDLLNKRNRFFTTLKFQRAIKNAGVGSGPQ